MDAIIKAKELAEAEISGLDIDWDRLAANRTLIEEARNTITAIPSMENAAGAMPYLMETMPVDGTVLYERLVTELSRAYVLQEFFRRIDEVESLTTA